MNTTSLVLQLSFGRKRHTYGTHTKRCRTRTRVVALRTKWMKQLQLQLQLQSHALEQKSLLVSEIVTNERLGSCRERGNLGGTVLVQFSVGQAQRDTKTLAGIPPSINTAMPTIVTLYTHCFLEGYGDHPRNNFGKVCNEYKRYSSICRSHAWLSIPVQKREIDWVSTNWKKVSKNVYHIWYNTRKAVNTKIISTFTSLSLLLMDWY